MTINKFKDTFRKMAYLLCTTNEAKWNYDKEIRQSLAARIRSNKNG